MKKKIALFLLLATTPAGAVEGYTVFNGPDVPIAASAGDTFPRYDLATLCRKAWPGDAKTTQAARTACETRQSRLAGLISYGWNKIPTQAQAKCTKRADNAGSQPYTVLFSCVNAAHFVEERQETAREIANLIRKQNGQPPVDDLSVGSIE
jgi:hypothetical protein